MTGQQGIKDCNKKEKTGLPRKNCGSPVFGQKTDISFCQEADESQSAYPEQESYRADFTGSPVST